MSIYKEHGYACRKDYLASLAEDFDIPLEDVLAIAGLYGPEEDFDGLITALEDYADELEEDE